MKNLPGGDGIVVGSVTKTDPEKKNYGSSIHLNYLAEMIKGIIVFQDRKDTKFSRIYFPLDMSCIQKLKKYKKHTGPYNYPNNTFSYVLLLEDQARLEVLDYKHIQNTVISDS